MLKRLHALLVMFSLLFIVACPGGGGTDDDVIVVECDGDTGATVSLDDDSATLTIPEGSVSDCLYMDPALSTSTETADLLDDSETLLSDIAYVLELNSDDDATATTTDDITLSLAFDASLVPAEDLDDLHVYANVLFTDDEGNTTVVPVFGEIDSGVFTATLNGLYATSTWVVVYNANMQATIYDADAAASESVGLTAGPGVLGSWAQNDWCVVYDLQDATLRQTIGTALGKAANVLTEAEIDSYLQTNVSLAAKIAGELYADGNFREPNLFVFAVSSAGSTSAVCTDATDDHYRILIAGSSQYYQSPTHIKGVNPFGELYVGSAEVNDLITSALGNTFDAIAHEMGHAIVAGYELYTLDNLLGYDEGTAATLGHTMGWSSYFSRITAESSDWDNITGIYVRTANATEVFLLSNSLNTGRLGGSEQYSNQDFYAYVANRYNANKLDYLSTVLQNFYTDFASIADLSSSDIRGYQKFTGFTHKQIFTSLSTSLAGLFGSDLPTIYTAFAVDRAYEHSSYSLLRSTDSATASLSTGLFAAASLLSESIDPNDLDDSTFSETGSFANVAAFSTVVLTITKNGSTTDDKTLNVEIADNAGVLTVGDTTTGDIRVAVRGDSSPAVAAGLASISSFGKDVSTVYVIISNTSTSSATINYTLTSGSGSGAVPSLSMSGCPTTMNINTSVPITLTYADNDGDISTLTETAIFDGDVFAVETVDATTAMPGTSGDYVGALLFEGSSEENHSLTFTIFITDATGNNSASVTCSTTLLAGGT